MPQTKRDRDRFSNIESLWQEAAATGVDAEMPSPVMTRIDVLLRTAEESVPGSKSKSGKKSQSAPAESDGKTAEDMDDFAALKAGFEEIARLKPHMEDTADDPPDHDSADTGRATPPYATAGDLGADFDALVTDITRRHINGALRPRIEKIMLEEIRAYFGEGGR